MNEYEPQNPNGEEFKARELTPADFGVTPEAAPDVQGTATIEPEVVQTDLEVDPSEQTKVDRIREAIGKRRDKIMTAALYASSSAVSTFINISTAESSPMWQKIALAAAATVPWVGAVKNSYEARELKAEINTLKGADTETGAGWITSMNGEEDV